jgi:hypothetical protein
MCIKGKQGKSETSHDQGLMEERRKAQRGRKTNHTTCGLYRLSTLTQEDNH